MKSYFLKYMLFLLPLLCIYSCAKYLQQYRSHYSELNAYLHARKSDPMQSHLQPFLKIHLKNGHVAIIQDPWIIDSLQSTITGNGHLYDEHRSLIRMGQLALSKEDIAILETNNDLNTVTNSRKGGLILLTVVNAALTISCLINPKACFGSCPTFYMEGQTELHASAAEGFSNAISPALAYTDIDALNTSAIADKDFTLIMKNEALETHCIDDVHLLVYPRATHERILHAPDDRFYKTDSIIALHCAKLGERDITPLLSHHDFNEWYSMADSFNLSSREEIVLSFDNNAQIAQPGLILGFRQTLMTTYFIYSAMGYMGDEVSDYFAKIETNRHLRENIGKGISRELGKIEVYLREDCKSSWKYQGELHETGPIALNHQVLPLRDKLKPGSELKLVQNKGLWRIDYIALSAFSQEVIPQHIYPYEIRHDDISDTSLLHALRTPGLSFASLPGETYTLHFKFPESDKDYEIFLSSRGYYLEWMRTEWLKEKSPYKLHQMMMKPKDYLQQEAAAYKEYERTMEETFWNSKITSKAMVYENN